MINIIILSKKLDHDKLRIFTEYLIRNDFNLYIYESFNEIIQSNNIDVVDCIVMDDIYVEYMMYLPNYIPILIIGSNKYRNEWINDVLKRSFCDIVFMPMDMEEVVIKIRNIKVASNRISDSI